MNCTRNLWIKFYKYKKKTKLSVFLENFLFKVIGIILGGWIGFLENLPQNNGVYLLELMFINAAIAHWSKRR